MASNYGPWISAGAVFVSASVAVLAIHHNQKVARRRATIDLVLSQKSNDELMAARKWFLKMHEDGNSFTTFACKEKIGTPEHDNILTVLNYLEFVATGIREKAFDEAVYKRVQYSTLVRDWNALKAFVTEFRNSRGRPTLFQEFEWLGERWKRKPLNAPKKRFWPFIE